MPINRKKNRGPGTPGYIPARSSQNGGQRACLCPDENTYSRECTCWNLDGNSKS